MIYLTYQFNKVTYTVCDDVAQWDTNQVMKISNLPYYCTYNLSYSKNGNIMTTETYLIEDSLIQFPNECFFEPGTIHCYIQREQDGETETIADILINVKERSIPSNTQPCDVRDGKLFVSSDGVKQGTMSEYNGETSISPSKDIIVLKTSGKFIENDITIEEIPEKYIEPSGTKTISKNGIHDVKEFESVDVHVETATLLQEKTVTPKKSSQTVTADKGFDGLSAVNIGPIPDEYVIQNLQEKTIIPTKSAQDVTADDDYTGLSAVHVEPIPDEYAIQNLQEKSVTPSDQEQSITADDGYTGLSGVTVGKIAKPFIDSSKMKYFGSMFASTYGTDLSLLENLDTSNGTDFSYMFQNRTDLTELPLLDTSNGTNFSHMFSGCTGLTELPLLDTSNGTNFIHMFSGCTKMKKIEQLDTSKATTLNSLFANTVALSEIPVIDTSLCTNLAFAFNQNWGYLTEITLTDTSKCMNWNSAFGKASHLVSIKSTLTINDAANVTMMFYGCYALENVTFDYIGIRNNSFSVQYSPLSEESLASIVNALSDNSGLATTYTVTLGATNLAKLTEEQLAIVAAKNINLA